MSKTRVLFFLQVTRCPLQRKISKCVTVFEFKYVSSKIESILRQILVRSFYNKTLMKFESVASGDQCQILFLITTVSFIRLMKKLCMSHATFAVHDLTNEFYFMIRKWSEDMKEVITDGKNFLFHHFCQFVIFDLVLGTLKQ